MDGAHSSCFNTYSAALTSSWLVQSHDNTHKLDSNPILLYMDSCLGLVEGQLDLVTHVTNDDFLNVTLRDRQRQSLLHLHLA